MDPEIEAKAMEYNKEEDHRRIRPLLCVRGAFPNPKAGSARLTGRTVATPSKATPYSTRTRRWVDFGCCGFSHHKTITTKQNYRGSN